MSSVKNGCCGGLGSGEDAGEEEVEVLLLLSVFDSVFLTRDGKSS